MKHFIERVICEALSLRTVSSGGKGSPVMKAVLAMVELVMLVVTPSPSDVGTATYQNPVSISQEGNCRYQ